MCPGTDRPLVFQISMNIESAWCCSQNLFLAGIGAARILDTYCFLILLVTKKNKGRNVRVIPNCLLMSRDQLFSWYGTYRANHSLKWPPGVIP